jgi:outer membrane receptor for monomeric catechols
MPTTAFLSCQFSDHFSSLTTITQQVKPEKFQHYEVGVKWDIQSFPLRFHTAAFRLDRYEHTSYRSKRSHENHPDWQPAHERL